MFGYFAGPGPWGELLTFTLFGLVGLGLLAKPGPNGASVVMEVRLQSRARFVSLLVAGPLAVAVLAGMLTGAAFDNRYIAVVFPLFIVLCALGLTAFSSRKVSAALLAVACTAGLFAAQEQNSEPRTQAVQVAADLNAQAQPGDVVVYCPDQLGPAVDRLLTGPRSDPADLPAHDRPRSSRLGRLCLEDPAHRGRHLRPGGMGPGQPRGYPVARMA